MEEAFLNRGKNPKVAIISFPWKSYAPYKFLSDLLRILEPISDKIVLINGNTTRINILSEKVEVKDIGISMHYLKDIEPGFYSAILWVTKCFIAQANTSLELVKARKEVDVVIFYVAYPYHLLPLITSKILRKRTVAVITGSKSNSLHSKIVGLQNPILFGLLDGISPESRALIKEWGLEKYKNKLLPEGVKFIEIKRYNIKKKLSDRRNVVGFIGRIIKEKGIVEFVRAIPFVAKEDKNVEFFIGGDGDLSNWVNAECNIIKNEYNLNIEIVGWIGQNLPDYLNELKLIVLPSYTEGLPSIILEAMACGTPVLATPVGGIPDIIKDGITGFILENNSSECIAKNIMRALNHPNLEEITENARALVEQKLTYEAAVERYKKIIEIPVRVD
jgi:glycosyltransferase involved in cell wall biosynthesis